MFKNEANRSCTYFCILENFEERGAAILFDKVISDFNGDYKKSSGIFSAPKESGIGD